MKSTPDKPDILKPLAWAALIVHIALTCALASCAFGPDWSPEVQSAAASFGGPVYAPNGAMLSPGTGSQNNRPTMFHP